MNTLGEETEEHWQAIGPLLTIRGDRDHAAALERVNTLLGESATTSRIRSAGYWIPSGTSSTPTRRSTCRFARPAGRRCWNT